MKFQISITTILATLLVSCVPKSAPGPIVSTPANIPVVTATFTPQPTATFTPQPAATFTPQPTPTPIPDPRGDPDGDGIITFFEQQRGTNPFSKDTDNDGIPDNNFGEIGEYTRVISGTVLIKAPPWSYLVEFSGDPNADLYQYHEVLEQRGNGIIVRFLIFPDVRYPLNPTSLSELPSLSLGPRIQASPESMVEIQRILESYSARTDVDALRALKKWFLINVDRGGIPHRRGVLNGREVDGFTIDNSWSGEYLFRLRKTEACGSNATLGSYLGNNLGIPTRIVHSIPIDGSGPNHFTNESLIGGFWIPYGLNDGDYINTRNPLLLKLDVFRDFGDVDFSRWDWYFANVDYSPQGQGMRGLYEILSFEEISPFR